ncbi:MAG: precorrin-6A synthase (deacetylating) [Rhodospirillales bacterium]
MRKIFLIGIGPGDPRYLTLQAIAAMKRADVFFLFEKAGRGKNELTRIRRGMIEKFAAGKKYRVVSAKEPERKIDRSSYRSGIDDWRRRKRAVTARLIKRELKANQTGAFLIWGDPCLYDGSIEILQSILAARDVEFEYAVVPGITSIQALAEKHRIPLNRAGESIAITTGRRLNDEGKREAENVVVMLDQHSAVKRFADKDAEFYWAAYLGMKDEVLLSGRLADVVDDYERIRTRARSRKGWIMDTYILRRAKRAK